MNSRAMTLIELIVSIVLISLIMAGVGISYLFIRTRILPSIERSNALMQVNYALGNIRLHCLSATRICAGYFLLPAQTPPAGALRFRGERDIYNITPVDTSNDTIYHYELDINGRLVLNTYSASDCNAPGSVEATEVLIAEQYNPRIKFEYTAGDEPNFFTVTIETFNRLGEPLVSKKEGIRLWFVDARG